MFIPEVLYYNVWCFILFWSEVQINIRLHIMRTDPIIGRMWKRRTRHDCRVYCELVHAYSLLRNITPRVLLFNLVADVKEQRIIVKLFFWSDYDIARYMVWPTKAKNQGMSNHTWTWPAHRDWPLIGEMRCFVKELTLLSMNKSVGTDLRVSV